ncbi:hypothetical protein [Desulfuromonas thiophila]|uniref:Lipase (Class 3) n=1 Tax=Desulfuromonas thiophila TaxID=57664 RepID=A0A1G7DPM4_9BACT|nr:hypothetical protein [Desulfuromonas thiophila]SDE53483.1 hypothetical protein SAMN05661003_1152 [Desulfuromonas thiophila]
MSTITDYYKYSELALASYSDLAAGMVQQDYIDALMNDGDGMSQKQAETFAPNWTVLDQYDGMVEETYYDEFGDEQTFLNPTGLSVTLFEDGSGKQVVAIRGTEPTDLDDIVTDIIDIGVLGTSEHQAQYAALSAQIQKWKDDGTLRTNFSVTGHSLGGFLATNLAREDCGILK